MSVYDMPDFNLSATIQTSLVGVTTFLLAKWLLRQRPKTRLPPGPKQLPYFGNALSLWRNEEIHLTFEEWAEKYGDVFSVKLGQYDMVVLNSKESIRDLLIHHGDVTSHRLTTFVHKLLNTGTRGIVNNMGEPLRHQRRTALSALRDFGVGKASLEDRIHEEADFMCDVIAERVKEPQRLDDVFISFSLNVIHSIIYGNRLEYDDPEFKYLKKETRFLFAQAGLKSVSMFFPEQLILAPFMLPLIYFGMRRIYQLQALILRKIHEEKESFDPDNIRHFVDLYLKEKEDGDADDAMFDTIVDLLLTATETTSVALNWCVLFLVTHPEIQERCRREITAAIGSSRPRYQDRGKMPYVEATVQETLRRGNIAALTLQHTTSAELRYRDYVLPSGTILTANLYAVHMDPQNYPDPLQFEPGRWLDQDGKCRTTPAYMPFGPRECLGRSLALQEFFLGLVSLLQRFRIHAEDPANPPRPWGKLGISHCPDPFRVVVEAF